MIFLKELRRLFYDALASQYPQTEVESFFYLSSEAILDYSRFDVSTHLDSEISDENVREFQNYIERLQNFEPIQYIIGATEFYGLNFKVNSHTLIPRPETEELVDWIVQECKINQWASPRVLDIGTGSGNIAISLASNIPNAQVTGVDISEETIEVAKENSEINKTNVIWRVMDILAVETFKDRYDIIVSNPPYVRKLEMESMNANVLDHEPASALFVSNETPLLFYDKISSLAVSALNDGGLLFFEINEYLSNEMHALLSSKGFSNISIRKDIYGKDRMVKCSRHE